MTLEDALKPAFESYSRKYRGLRRDIKWAVEKGIVVIFSDYGWESPIARDKTLLKKIWKLRTDQILLIDEGYFRGKFKKGILLETKRLDSFSKDEKQDMTVDKNIVISLNELRRKIKRDKIYLDNILGIDFKPTLSQDERMSRVYSFVDLVRGYNIPRKGIVLSPDPCKQSANLYCGEGMSIMVSNIPSESGSPHTFNISGIITTNRPDRVKRSYSLYHNHNCPKGSNFMTKYGRYSGTLTGIVKRTGREILCDQHVIAGVLAVIDALEKIGEEAVNPFIRPVKLTQMYDILTQRVRRNNANFDLLNLEQINYLMGKQLLFS